MDTFPRKLCPGPRCHHLPPPRHDTPCLGAQPPLGNSKPRGQEHLSVQCPCSQDPDLSPGSWTRATPAPGWAGHDRHQNTAQPTPSCPPSAHPPSRACSLGGVPVARCPHAQVTRGSSQPTRGLHVFERSTKLGPAPLPFPKSPDSQIPTGLSGLCELPRVLRAGVVPGCATWRSGREQHPPRDLGEGLTTRVIGGAASLGHKDKLPPTICVTSACTACWNQERTVRE